MSSARASGSTSTPICPKDTSTARTIVTSYIGDTDHNIRQAKKAGVLSAAVQTGGQAVKYLHKIQAQNPRYRLDSFAGLCAVVST